MRTTRRSLDRRLCAIDKTTAMTNLTRMMSPDIMATIVMTRVTVKIQTAATIDTLRSATTTRFPDSNALDMV
jgi:hypothetical protein